MPTNLPRYELNERVDLTDFDYTVDDALQAMVRQPNEEFLTDPGGATKSWIIDGFAMSDLGAGQLKITKGRAILAQREGSEIHYGALTTEGDASKTLDLSGYGNNTYNTYIRFQYVDAETQSRIFWNPAVPAEFAQSIQTRRQANWSMRVELASPGDEWVQIGTVEIAAGVIGGAGIVDQRNFYFEGSVSGTYANTWGGGNDRNADRQQYGIKDLQTFTAAVRTLFEDLRPTGGRWWEARGLKATGKAASNEPGMDGLGDGSGPGLKGIGGATNDSSGVFGDGANSAATNSRGGTFTGKGTGYGAKATGGVTGAGVEGVGGSTSGYGGNFAADVTTPASASLHVGPQDTAPSVPVKGNVFIHSVNGKIQSYNGAIWDRNVAQSITMVTQATNIFNDAAEAIFDQNYTIPANTLIIGSVIRIRALCNIVSVNAAPSIEFRIRIGGLAGTNLTDPVIIDPAGPGYNTWLEAYVTVATIGAGGTMAYGGLYVSDLGSTGIRGGAIGVGLDTTAGQQIVVTADWSAAHADNVARLVQLIVDVS